MSPMETVQNGISNGLQRWGRSAAALASILGLIGIIGTASVWAVSSWADDQYYPLDTGTKNFAQVNEKVSDLENSVADIRESVQDSAKLTQKNFGTVLVQILEGEIAQLTRQISHLEAEVGGETERLTSRQRFEYNMLIERRLDARRKKQEAEQLVRENNR